MSKEIKCEACWIFKKIAIGYLEFEWVSKRRIYVCEKHKEEMMTDNEKESFRNPTFAPKVTFYPLNLNN